MNPLAPGVSIHSLDGRRIKTLAYGASKGNLAYTKRLKPGRHAAKTVATDEAGNRAARSWRFTVR